MCVCVCSCAERAFSLDTFVNRYTLVVVPYLKPLFQFFLVVFTSCACLVFCFCFLFFFLIVSFVVFHFCLLSVSFRLVVVVVYNQLFFSPPCCFVFPSSRSFSPFFRFSFSLPVRPTAKKKQNGVLFTSASLRMCRHSPPLPFCLVWCGCTLSVPLPRAVRERERERVTPLQRPFPARALSVVGVAFCCL